MNLDLAQILQLGTSGVLAAGVIALWRKLDELLQQQREDNREWRLYLQTMLEQGRADRKAIAAAVDADLERSRTDIPKMKP